MWSRSWVRGPRLRSYCGGLPSSPDEAEHERAADIRTGLRRAGSRSRRPGLACWSPNWLRYVGPICRKWKARMPDLVLHITGARPNFPKAAPVIRGLAALGVPQELVHTGQHYDEQMSDVFFRQLGLPEPDVNLGVGSGTHAQQTAAIMTGLEVLIEGRQPAMVVVYGDVNSTVAAALVTAKLLVPLAHVEAGLRSFDMTMPEEVNRIVTDRLADLLFATSPDAIAHLGNEGIDPSKIHFVGNPMIDTLLANMDRFDVAAIRSAHDLAGPYAVATLHRPSNVDDPADAAALVKAMHSTADQIEVLLPLHPRGRARLETAGLLDHPRMRVIDPLWRAGRSHHPGCSVLHPTTEHRAADYHHARHQSARYARAAASGDRGFAACGAAHNASRPATLGWSRW
jgi:UDP-N-acetylglucosamine 2-epimerase (non-hydrolysing)